MSDSPSKKDLKTFSLIWSAIFLVIGIYPLVRSALNDSLSAVNLQDLRVWALIVSFAFLAVAIFIPAILTQFYKVWVKFGELIGGVVSKIVLLILFYGVFTPISVFLRIFKKDLLRKKLDKDAKSYWIDRETQPGSLTNQF